MVDCRLLEYNFNRKKNAGKIEKMFLVRIFNNKGDVQECENIIIILCDRNYKGIKLIRCMATISSNQFGFMLGKPIMEQIF